MARRGTFYAITVEEAEQLLALVGNDAELSRQVLELYTPERQRKRFIAPVDHAWDILHRCLTDGTLNGLGKGAAPLDWCVLGGRSIYGGKEFIVCYITPDQTAQIAAVLDEIQPPWLVQRYWNLPAAGYSGTLNNEGLEYAWDYFTNMRSLYSKAAGDGRGVVFVMDQ